MKAPCTATAKHGGRCQAFAPDGSQYCRVHDPDRQAEVRAARSRGTANAAKLRSIEGRRPRLDNPRSLAQFLASRIHDLAEGRLELDLAKVIFYGCSVQRGVVELADKSDVQQLLAEVRALVSQARRPA